MVEKPKITRMIKSSQCKHVWKIWIYSQDITEEDADYIRDLVVTIYHNDLECYLWAFDVVLPSGRWLENIRFTNNLKTAAAIIL